jgi:hypothetical protein
MEENRVADYYSDTTTVIPQSFLSEISVKCQCGFFLVQETVFEPLILGIRAECSTTVLHM